MKSHSSRIPSFGGKVEKFNRVALAREEEEKKPNENRNSIGKSPSGHINIFPFSGATFMRPHGEHGAEKKCEDRWAGREKRSSHDSNKVNECNGLDGPAGRRGKSSQVIRKTGKVQCVISPAV